MKCSVIDEKNKIAQVISDTPVVIDIPSALDLIATLSYETDCHKAILTKALFAEDFFQLKTKLAGEIIEKFVQYHVVVAIVGDFSVYQSESLAAFIRESNRGKHVFFLPSMEIALEKLRSL
ncbi:MAG: DUF4180 domain-containing protein [Christensenellaceae bacterium]